jgi:Mandelate racemase / muconate lactonizing enzyme, N-terminal domain
MAGARHMSPHGKEKVVAECVEAMAAHVVGRSVFNIRHTAQIMSEDFATRRISLELMAAWSAIEIASWDIIGKRAWLAGLQPDRRRVARAGASLRQWLVARHDDRGGGRARSQGQGDGVSPPPNSTPSLGRGGAMSIAATRISRSTTSGRCGRRWDPISNC